MRSLCEALMNAVIECHARCAHDDPVFVNAAKHLKNKLFYGMCAVAFMMSKSFINHAHRADHRPVFDAR